MVNEDVDKVMVEGRKMAPKDVHSLFLETPEEVTSQSKKDLQLGFRVRALRPGEQPDYSDGPSNPMGP